MKKIILYLILIGFASCGVVETKPTITENDVKNYISTYKAIREKAPNVLQQLNENVGKSDKSIFLCDSIQDIVKANGIDSCSHFIRLNAMIGSVFAIIQASKTMGDFENLNNNSQNQIDNGVQELQKLIDDPNIPEANKEEYRKQIEELQAGKDKLEKNWKSGEFWVNWVIKGVEKITGFIVSAADIEIIQKFEQELLEIYAGFPAPAENYESDYEWDD